MTTEKINEYADRQDNAISMIAIRDIDVLLNKTVMAGSQPDSADIIYRGGGDRYIYMELDR